MAWRVHLIRAPDASVLLGPLQVQIICSRWQRLWYHAPQHVLVQGMYSCRARAGLLVPGCLADSAVLLVVASAAA